MHNLCLINLTTSIVDYLFDLVSLSIHRGLCMSLAALIGYFPDNNCVEFATRINYRMCTLIRCDNLYSNNNNYP